MSQHDYVLDNQARSSFRADANNALQALASQNKGSSAPSTKYTGMSWIDDSASPWTLKLWDGADWITVGTIDPTGNLFTPANADVFPIGACVEYYGTVAPSSSWMFPYGQAISRSAYSVLFGRFSTRYGGGDGSTTFNLPNRAGRIAIGRDDMSGSPAGLITSAGGGIDGVTLGATGGSQSSGALVAHSHSNGGPPSVTPATVDQNGDGATISVVQSLTAGGTTGSSGSGSAFSILPPGIVCNFILKVL